MFVKIFVWKIHFKFFLRKCLIGYPHILCGKAVYNMFITYFPHQNVKSVENHIYFSTDFYTTWNITAHVINIVFHIIHTTYYYYYYIYFIIIYINKSVTQKNERMIKMKFVCYKDTIIKALNSVVKGVASKTTMPK